MMAVWRLLAKVGGIPCLLTSLRIPASAYLARLTQRRRFSTKVSAEYNQTPSHLVASFAKKTCWSPAWIGLLLFFLHCLRFIENSSVSVLLVSNPTALSPAQRRLPSALRHQV